MPEEPVDLAHMLIPDTKGTVVKIIEHTITALCVASIGVVGGFLLYAYASTSW